MSTPPTREDEKWQLLLSRCAPTFAGETTPPYGFITGTMAQLRTEKRQEEELERIGWRALLASLATLMAIATLTAGLHLRDRNDLEPGVKSIIEVENVPVS
jgi:hypothetical protein